MTGPRVTIVSTRIANIASVGAAFRRLGAEIDVTDDPRRLRTASRTVLPGVGSFDAGMESLRSRGLSDAIIERAERERPLLAVCLGMQLLCASSEEAPGTHGLGVIDAHVRRFAAGARTPQFGWNRVEPGPDSALIRPGFAYYANSYRAADAPDGWAPSTSEHGGPFVAALERGPVLACQFHPELSGEWGRALLTRWLVQKEVGAPC